MTIFVVLLIINMRTFQEYKEYRIQESFISGIVTKVKDGVTFFFDKVKNVLLQAVHPAAMDGYNEKGVSVYTSGEKVPQVPSLPYDTAYNEPSSNELDNLKKFIREFSNNNNNISEAYGDALSGFGEKDSSGSWRWKNRQIGDSDEYTTNNIIDILLPDAQKRILNDIPYVINHGDSRGLHHIIPVVLFGSPGIGKTSIVKGLITEYNKKQSNDNMKLGFIHIDCANLGLDSLSLVMPTRQVQKNKIIKQKLGMEDGGEEESYIEDIPKSWLPCYKPTGDPEEDKKRDMIANGNVTLDGVTLNGGVILLDELLRVQDSGVFGQLMNIINDRKYNGYVLGSKWSVVMVSNRPNDDSKVMNMLSQAPKAMFDRCHVYNVIPDASSWIKWARETGRVDSALLNFIQGDKAKRFANLDNNDINAGELVGTTPRKWEDVSIILNTRVARYNEEEGTNYKSWIDLSESELKEIFCGTVGVEMWNDFKISTLPLLKYSSKKSTDEEEKVDPVTDIIKYMDIIEDKESSKDEISDAKNMLKNILNKTSITDINIVISKKIQEWGTQTNKRRSYISKCITSVFPDLKGRLEEYIVS